MKGGQKLQSIKSRSCSGGWEQGGTGERRLVDSGKGQRGSLLRGDDQMGEDSGHQPGGASEAKTQKGERKTWCAGEGGARSAQ